MSLKRHYANLITALPLCVGGKTEIGQIEDFYFDETYEYI